MLLHPFLPNKPSIYPTAHAISHHGLEPHEGDTEKAGDDSRIHRSDDEGVCTEIFLCHHPDTRDGCHLWTWRRCYVTTEEEDTVEGKAREKKSDAPCKSFLDGSHPDFFSFFEIHTHEGPKDAPFRTEKDLRHELKYHQAHEYEWDRVFGLKEHEEK